MNELTLDLFSAPTVPAVPPQGSDKILAEIQHLTRQIQRANEAYYIYDQPELTDSEYDHLMNRLRTLEKEYPALKQKDSPTQRVGAPLEKSLFKKQKHLTPMLSLPNAFSNEELREWIIRESKSIGETISPLFGELKIDGASLALTYEEGRLIRAVTRGNGEIGEDVTENAKTIKGIPHTLAPSDISLPRLFEVRGEVYMTKSGLAALNTTLLEAGQQVKSNTRNTASGSLRQKDPAVTASRQLNFFAYTFALPQGVPLPVKRQEDLMNLFDRLGFATCQTRKLCQSFDEVAEFIIEVESLRTELDFDIDGIVFKVDSLSLQKRLGAVDRDPKWAMARKWLAEAVKTRLLSIEIQVGRTGKLTPVAIMEPVYIGGVTVCNATLHNEDYITTLGLKIGDHVFVTRAGEVIPQVLGVSIEDRTGDETDWDFPRKCPSCGEHTNRLLDKIIPALDETPETLVYAADSFCENAECPAQAVRRIQHFASREAMEIRGLGNEISLKLINCRLITSIADIYDLTIEGLLEVDGFAQSSAKNLIDSINASKTRPVHRLLFGLGIRHVGKTVARLLIDNFSSLRRLSAANEDELLSIDGIGIIVARSVITYFSAPSTQREIDRLEKAGLTTTEEKTAQVIAEGILSGKTFVITGALNSPRDEVEELIRQAGGKVSSSVSKKTDFLVCGSDAGSKLTKATALGVSIIGEQNLRDMIS